MKTLEEELAEIGIVPKLVHLPRRQKPLVRILVRTENDSNDVDIAGTVAAILKSGCQDFTVEVVAGGHDLSRLESWLATDARFSVLPGPTSPGPGSYFTLVVLAGVALGTHSVEALVDAALTTDATVLRALVDGHRGAVEFWQTDRLVALSALGDPEKAARTAGGERWVSGNSLGLHHCRRPKPKMYLRQGAAATHDLNILVRDVGDRATRRDYEAQIRYLENRLNASLIARRKLEQGVVPPRGASRVLAVALRGRGYLLARIKLRLGRES